MTDLASTTIKDFLVKQLKPQKHGLTELDLSTAIQEIEIQTQIYGASFLKVHLIDSDPLWAIQTSGLLKVNEDGLLQELEVEFPEHTKYFWRLAAVEGTTEISQANLVLTFEDRIVARLREQWGHRTIPAGSTTRAQFVKALVNEANLKEHLNPRIRFVSPGISRIEPVEESAAEKKEKFQTAPAKAAEEAHNNKERGIHAGAEFKIKGSAPSPIQRALANEVLSIAAEHNAGQLATEALIEACIAENDFTNNPGGGGGSTGLLQLIPSTAASLGVDPLNVKQTVTAFLTKTQGSATGGAIGYAQAHPNAPAYEVAQAVQASGAGASSKGASNYGVVHKEAEEIIHGFGGVTAGGTSSHSNESDVGQLSRGTPQNPDEDSWDCITRLTQEVNWSAFTDGRNTLFYMDGPDLIAQRPVLYLDVKNNHIIREDKGGQKVSEFGSIMRPVSYTYDNVSFQYRASHKVKGKLQRKARIAKPQTPAEVRINILAGITEYRAGDVFVFRNCGPISENGGRWIVADATRECLKYPYTKFILVPPTEPLPEPKAAPTEGPLNAPTGTGQSPGIGTYGWLIGNTAAFAGLDQGMDFTGRAEIFALDNGKITRLERSGSGWPGEGALMVYELTAGQNKGRFVYTAEDFKPATGLAKGMEITKGQPIGEATGSGKAPGIETGFAQNADGQAYGSVHDGKGGAPPSPEAVAFQHYVTGK